MIIPRPLPWRSRLCALAPSCYIISNDCPWSRNRRNPALAGGKWVAYYRVSTAKQGASGLGLEAQREAVAGYIAGGNWQLAAEFTEVESGRKKTAPSWPRPRRVPAHRGHPDHRQAGPAGPQRRLRQQPDGGRRRVRRGGLPDRQPADHPHPRRGRRARARDDLRPDQGGARRRQGPRGQARQPRRLGRGPRQGTAAAVAGEAKAAARAADLAPVIAEIKAGGRTSLRAIAAELDARGIPAPRGGKWTAAAVMRLTAADLETRR